MILMKVETNKNKGHCQQYGLEVGMVWTVDRIHNTFRCVKSIQSSVRRLQRIAVATEYGKPRKSRLDCLAIDIADEKLNFVLYCGANLERQCSQHSFAYETANAFFFLHAHCCNKQLNKV